MLNFGRDPDRATVHLSRDAGFVQPFQTDTGTAYPGGATMTLVIKLDDGSVVATWAAAISGDTATFSQTAAQVNAVLNTAGQKTAHLFYDETTSEPLEMAYGPVREHK